MEDGVKEEPAKPKEVKCRGKAGWLKKSSGKFLSSYKDRYIQLDHTEIVIYENEELTACLERVDLDNYEKCHELKSPFKKKHRLVLIRSPKSGNKVQDVKFQAQTPEEKEAWITALSDGINKAKNKIFDEVTVDEGCSLEHVTRSRPKGNRGRRPPTRIHMKEVANVSSDGHLRLDLDGEVTMQNGTHCLNSEGDKEPETLKPTVTLNNVPEEDEEDSTPQKKVIKPPMPPSKDNKPNDNHKEDEAKSEEPTPPKKILTPPMPPSKENKPSVSSQEIATDNKLDTEAKSTDISEPAPSTKSVQPPAPPSKHMKPSQPATVTTEKLEEVDGEDIEVDVPPDENQLKTEEVGMFTLSSKIIKPQVVMWDSPTVASKEPPVEQEEQDLQKAPDSTGEVTTFKEPHQLNVTPLATPETVKKIPGPPAPPKKPFKPSVKTEDTPPQSNPMVLTTTPSSEPVSEQSSDKAKAGGDMSSEDIEEKSLDSGQHSGEESEMGDQVTPSTTKLKGSSQGLDGETSEDDLEPSDSKAESLMEPSSETPTTTPETSVLNTHPTPSQGANKSLHITVPLKRSSKVRSASLGDLLSPDKEETEGKDKEIPITTHGDDMNNLQSKVSYEMAQTEEMLNAIAAGQSRDTDGGASPEILLNAAMEKLRKADEFLREARSFKDLNKSNRLSF